MLQITYTDLVNKLERSALPSDAIGILSEKLRAAVTQSSQDASLHLSKAVHLEIEYGWYFQPIVEKTGEIYLLKKILIGTVKIKPDIQRPEYTYLAGAVRTDKEEWVADHCWNVDTAQQVREYVQALQWVVILIETLNDK